MLSTLVRHPDEFRAFVAQYFEEPVDMTKKRLLVRFFLCPLRDQLPLLWCMFDEVQRATDFLLEDAEYEYLKGMFAERPSPRATRLSYALCAMEDALLQQSIDSFARDHPDSQVMVLMFDGLILNIRPQHRGGLPDALAAFAARTGVSVTSSELSLIGGSTPATNGDQPCLMRAVAFLKARKTLTGPGPFALSDGADVLRVCGLGLEKISPTGLRTDGKCLLYSAFHFFAAEVQGERARVMDHGALTEEEASPLAAVASSCFGSCLQHRPKQRSRTSPAGGR